MDRRLKIVLIVIAGLVGYGFSQAVFNKTYAPKVTQEAVDVSVINMNTSASRSAYVKGCTDEAGPDFQVTCGCMFDNLLALYPDFATNTERISRILTSGYTTEETNVMVSCIN